MKLSIATAILVGAAAAELVAAAPAATAIAGSPHPSCTVVIDSHFDFDFTKGFGGGIQKDETVYICSGFEKAGLSAPVLSPRCRLADEDKTVKQMRKAPYTIYCKSSATTVLGKKANASSARKSSNSEKNRDKL